MGILPDSDVKLSVKDYIKHKGSDYINILEFCDYQWQQAKSESQSEYWEKCRNFMDDLEEKSVNSLSSSQLSWLDKIIKAEGEAC